MTYRAWNTKTVDRAALKELTAAIAQQNTEELEYQNMDEEWSEEKYRSVLAAQQKEAGVSRSSAQNREMMRFFMMTKLLFASVAERRA